MSMSVCVWESHLTIAQPGKKEEPLPPWVKCIMMLQPLMDVILINEINWHQRVLASWRILLGDQPLLHDVGEEGVRAHNLAL